MITGPCNEHPFTSHFYIVKLGFTRVYIFFLCLIQNIDQGYSIEPPQWGGSNVYPRSMFWAKIRRKKYVLCVCVFFLHLKITICTPVKYCSILYGDICVNITLDVVHLDSRLLWPRNTNHLKIFADIQLFECEENQPLAICIFMLVIWHKYKCVRSQIDITSPESVYDKTRY